jgi:hypothetical protein
MTGHGVSKNYILADTPVVLFAAEQTVYNNDGISFGGALVVM